MESQKNVLLFLNELKTQLQNGNVKSLSNIREKFGLLPQVLTTIFEMGIVSKNRPDFLSKGGRSFQGIEDKTSGVEYFTVSRDVTTNPATKFYSNN